MLHSILSKQPAKHNCICIVNYSRHFDIIAQQNVTILWFLYFLKKSKKVDKECLVLVMHPKGRKIGFWNFLFMHFRSESQWVNKNSTNLIIPVGIFPPKLAAVSFSQHFEPDSMSFLTPVISDKMGKAHTKCLRLSQVSVAESWQHSVPLSFPDKSHLYVAL